MSHEDSVRGIPPALAGIRAVKHSRLAFPCERTVAREATCHETVTLDDRCGGSTRQPCGLVFPV